MSSSVIDKLYAVTDKGPIRALSLVLALILAGCVFWDPTRFAAKTSSLEISDSARSAASGALFSRRFPPL